MTASLPVPAHIAIVMDGNGRWARQHRVPTAIGHKTGVEAVRAVLEACEALNVQALTLFAFSSENWRRPALEVRALMSLFSTYLDNEVASLAERQVRLRLIGRRDRFPAALREKIERAEQKTANNSRFHLTLAVDYGGQWDITQAAQALAVQVQQGVLQPADIDESCMAAAMCLADLPLPDLLIRTSGEHRLSNFLLWQLAYAEFYFTDVLWPDFGRAELEQAVACYQQRDRRFGARQEAQEI